MCTLRKRGEIQSKKGDFVLSFAARIPCGSQLFFPPFFSASKSRLIEVSSLGAAINGAREGPLSRRVSLFSLSCTQMTARSRRLATASIKR